MKGRKLRNGLFCLCLSCCLFIPMASHARIAGDFAFEGAEWEILIEDYIYCERGIVQSIVLTTYYLVSLENVRRHGDDVIKAYHRGDVDRHGNPVEQFSLAHRVQNRNWEHGNGMAYNPNTGEIAVALYTNHIPENRGSLYIMCSLTFEHLRTVKVTDDFNILGIGYDIENDRYIIQTNHDANYSMFTMSADFEIMEFIGEFGDVNIGRNFQDLTVSGDYVFNWPLVLRTPVDNHILVYSIERGEMVAAIPVCFGFADTVTWNEPESIFEMEPGVFVASVTVVDNDQRLHRFYRTMVPVYLPAVEIVPRVIAVEVTTDELSAEVIPARGIEFMGEVFEVSGEPEIRLATISGMDRMFSAEFRYLTLALIALVAGGIFYLHVLYIRRERAWLRSRYKRQRRRLIEMMEENL